MEATNLSSHSISAFLPNDHSTLSPKSHSEILEEKCLQTSAAEGNASGHCHTIWDTVLCWPKTPAGKLASLHCPPFPGFDTSRFATKLCTENGTWFRSSKTQDHWTNYTSCKADIHTPTHEDNIISEWLPVIKRISQVGYAVSFFTLILALIILVSIKKLRCPRNTLHMHLFVSFLLRAFMALFKDTVFIDGIGLPKSMKDGAFTVEQSNWECKLVTSLWQYFIVANYTWILMEGLYLHNLIFLAPFSDSSAITLYVLLGWGCPLLVVGSWVIARTTLDDTLCWTTHQSNEYLFNIIRIPIIISIVLNFLFFVNIVRVLLLKLQSAVSIETRKYRYSKWAKSTLVLMPLFGVHYMVFIGMSYYQGKDSVIETIWLFCDQFFASFQGFFVSILYCLLNGEVRSELGKKWNNWKSEAETKNIWVPLNQISSKFYHRSTHDDLLTNGLSLAPGNTVNGSNGNGNGVGGGHDFASCRGEANNKSPNCANGKNILDVQSAGSKSPSSNQELTETHNLTQETNDECIKDVLIPSSSSPSSKRSKRSRHSDSN